MQKLPLVVIFAVGTLLSLHLVLDGMQLLNRNGTETNCNHIRPSTNTQSCSTVPFTDHVKSWAVLSNKRKVLVTGAAGFIGSHVADFCAVEMNMHVIGVDDLSGGFTGNTEVFIQHGGVFVQGDLRDVDFVNRLFAEHGPFDVVYHIAAYAAEGLSHFIRTFNYENNLLASMHIINACISQPPMALVFTSSIASYGKSDGRLPLEETSPQRPEDPYGIAKFAVEMDLMAAHHMFGLNYIIFRPHNVYGPRQNIADKFRNAVGIFMNQILRGEPITIFGDGEQTRGFSYVTDVAQLIASSPAFTAAYNNDFFVGSDLHYSVNHLATMVSDSMNQSDYPLIHLDARNEVQHAYAVHHKIRCVFNQFQAVDLKEGLIRTAEFVRQHGSFEPTGYMKVEVRKNLPPSWDAWLQKTAVSTDVTLQCSTKDVILSNYNTYSSTPSDINEHLPVILQYAERVEYVTEIGVRHVISSWAFAQAGVQRISQAKPFTYKALDITEQASVKDLKRVLSDCPGIRFSFTEADDLKIEPWFTNLLFIDTWHSGKQLIAELKRWSPFTSDVIILHDTTLFAHTDEDLSGHGGKPVEDELYAHTKSHQGLIPAIEEFISSHSEWVIHEKRVNNNGLTILKRVIGFGFRHVGSISTVTSPSTSVFSGIGPLHRKKTDVVMFVPTPIPWEERRGFVYRQFMREKWQDSQVVLIFVLGTRTGPTLKEELDTSGVQQLPGATYIFTPCRDFGDEFDNENGTSATTCKVYEACKYIAKHYESRFVWRGADDTYVNLKLFIHTIMPTLQVTRLYMGNKRHFDGGAKDLLLERQPRLQRLFGLHQFGHYMHGMGFVFSSDVAEFIGTLQIPPRQTWIEDIMVGMWLNPFEIDWVDVNTATPYVMQNIQVIDTSRQVLAVHYMANQDWARIGDDGKFV